MKAMYVYTCVTIFCACIASVDSYAQDKRKKPDQQDKAEKIEKRVERLNTALSLSEDQSASIRNLLLQEAQNAAAERDNYGNDREARKEARESRKQKIQAGILDILDDEQDEKYLAMLEKHEGKAKKRRNRD